MNRSSRESPKRVRKPSMAVQALQGRPVKDESLEFFSWLKKCPSVLPNETKAGQPGGVQGKRKSKINGKVETDDLLSTDIGKNEYDWLLTPPAAPSIPSHPKPSLTAKENPKVRSISATRPSRLSQESTNSSSNSNPRLARSSSVTRSSISNTTTRSSISQSIARSSSISNTMTRSSIMSNSTTRLNSSYNTSTLSSTSRSPHNPTKQSPTSVTSKTSSSLTRPISARPSSPLKIRNPLTTQNPLSDKPKPLSSSSPSSSTTKTSTTTTTPRQPTPTRRATSSMMSSTTNPRQPTPTRRGTSSMTSSTTIPRQPTPTRSATSSVPPVSRSSSLTRLPDTKNKKIPTLTERSGSAVRQRLIGATASMSLNRRPATSPVSSPRKNMTRSQFGENLGKSRLSGSNESRKPTRPIENTSRKLVKPVPANDKTALTRTSSKKTLDPNAKIIDKSIGGSRRAPLYPRSNSNRSLRSRSESASRSGMKIVPTDDQTSHGTSSDRAASDDGLGSGRLVQSDKFESSRYDAILLKEDVQNLSWLHEVDESVLQCMLLRFDPPPEPFDI